MRVTRIEKLQQRAAAIDRADAIITAATDAGRALRAEEQAELASLHRHVELLTADLAADEREKQLKVFTLRPLAE